MQDVPYSSIKIILHNLLYTLLVYRGNTEELKHILCLLLFRSDQAVIKWNLRCLRVAVGNHPASLLFVFFF